MGKKIKQEDTQPTEKQVFIIKGGIHAGRDVIQGDQTNYITQQIANIQSSAEFVRALNEVQAQIAALKTQPGLDDADIKMIEVVEGRIAGAADEAKKDKPAPDMIVPKLEKAKATLETFNKSLGAAAALGTTLGGLVALAIKLFGG